MSVRSDISYLPAFAFLSITWYPGGRDAITLKRVLFLFRDLVK